MVGCPVPLDPAEHARARHARGVGPVDDLGVQRLAMPGVVLADDDGQPAGRAGQRHRCPPRRWLMTARASAALAQQEAMANTGDAARYARAATTRASTSNSCTSTA